ncbi:UNVERIFIED_CONTAM: hypothetical protein BEN50_10725 [Euhalothece sp. KZN 001]
MTRLLLFSFSLSVVLVSSFGLSPASSQTTLEEESPYQSSERDSFSSGLGEGLSPFDLIHGINSSRGMSMEQYRNQQQESLDSAASSFRQQQQQLLQQESLESPENAPLTEEESTQ